MDLEITGKNPHGLWGYRLETRAGMVSGAVDAKDEAEARLKVNEMLEKTMSRSNGVTTRFNKRYDDCL